MATAKTAKQSKESYSLETISKLMDEKLDKRFDLVFEKFDMLTGKIDAFETKLSSVMKDLHQHEIKFKDMEESIRQKDSVIGALQKDLTSALRQIDQHKFKLMDLENRSRRQNLRIIGLPENTETGDPITFFSKFLMDVFGSSVLEKPPEIDRAHRVARFQPSPQGKPRPVIIRFHYPQVKEQLIRIARRTGMFRYHDMSFRFVEDFSPEVLRLRMAFRPVMKEVFESGLKQSLLYPAHLRIHLSDGSRRFFKTSEEVKTFLSEYRSSTSA